MFILNLKNMVKRIKVFRGNVSELIVLYEEREHVVGYVERKVVENRHWYSDLDKLKWAKVRTELRGEPRLKDQVNKKIAIEENLVLMIPVFIVSIIRSFWLRQKMNSVPKLSFLFHI